LAKGKFMSDSKETYTSSPIPQNPHFDGTLNTPHDRRKTRRIRDPVLIFLYQDRLHEKAAKPLDLCPEGIGIETTEPLKVKEQLKMAIIIGECQINALGTVVYTKSLKTGTFRSGIKFDGISERNRGVIQLYLEKTQDMRRNGDDGRQP